jgi:glycosyltransferase involved in cell wall biosynthesis
MAMGRWRGSRELLIDAFAIARRERPLHLAIIGSGPDGEREKLMDRAVSLGIADDVWLPGHMPNPFPYYRNADLFVLSSRWEGMSNALLEAMACGCRVAAVTSAVGSAEILDNDRYGPLVRPEPEALARAMLATLAHGVPAETLLARAREFDLAKSMSLYVELLKLHAARMDKSSC